MAQIVRALARVRNAASGSMCLSGRDPLADGVHGICRSLGVSFRDRLFRPLLTVELFLLQILFGNTAITHLRQSSGIDSRASVWSCADGQHGWSTTHAPKLGQAN
jgi:hypothetical protein